MFICGYCKKQFENFSGSQKANHSRWCIENPKRNEYVEKLKYARKQITPEVRKKINYGIKEAHAKGSYKGSPTKSIDTRKKRGNLGHTDRTKQILKEKALASTHRRLKKGMIEYKGIMLDSKWELELAKRLDELEIKWIRPAPIPWVDEKGLTHNYFPDFYLEDYNLFLDPKNPQAIKVQKKKIEMLLQQYKNIVIIDTIEKCKNFNV